MVSTQDISLNIQSEVKSQGLNELKGISDEIAKIAGAGNFAAESIQVLQYVLETLQNSKGFSSIREISNQLANTLKQLKQIATGTSKTNKNPKDLLQDTVTSVATIKRSYGQSLTTNERTIVANIESATIKLDNTTDSLLKAVETFTSAATKLTDSDPVKANRLGKTAVHYGEVANSYARIPSEIEKNRAQADFLNEKTTRQKSINQTLKDLGLEENYNEAGIRGRIARARLQELKVLREEQTTLKKMYIGSGLRENVRSGLQGMQDSFSNRRGLVGFAARFGENFTRNKAVGDILNGGIKGAGVNLGGIAFGAAAIAVEKLGKSIYELGKESLESFAAIEKVKTNLGVVYGNQGEADRMFEQISQYAVKSPFGVKETAEQAILLKQSGVANYELMDTLKMVGDLAGGNQEKMARISNALAQISSNETATTRQLRMFTMAGIPIYDALSKILNTSTSGVRKKVEASEVKYEDIVNAFRRLTGEGGSFYQSVEKGARTYSARQTNLADVKQLGLSNVGEWLYQSVREPILRLQEDAWELVKDISENKVKNKRRENVERIDRQLGEYDDRIAVAEEMGAYDIVKYLQVEKMQVADAQIYTKDKIEAINAEEYTDAKQGLRDQLAKENLVTEKLNQLAALYDKIAGYGYDDSMNEEDFAEVMDRISVIREQLALLGHSVSAADAESIRSIAQSLSYSSTEFEKAYENFNKVSSVWSFGKERTRDWTKQEIAANAVSSRSLLTESAERASTIGKKQGSGNSLLNRFDSFYAQTYGAKEEAKKSNEAVIEELRTIANEIKDLNLKEDKFGFVYDKISKTDDNGNTITESIKKDLTAETIIPLLNRYLDTESTEKLSFENESDFNENQKVLSENIKSLGDAFKASLTTYSMQKFGNLGFQKEVSAMLGSLGNSKSYRETQGLLADFDEIIKKIDNGPLKELASIITSRANILDIDETKLDIAEREKKGKLAYDTAYAPLIRELTDSILGVSLYRSMGSDLGAYSGTPSEKNNFYQNIEDYMKNGFARQYNAAITRALLSQVGKDKVSWMDISRNVVASDNDYYRRRNQTYLNKNGMYTDQSTFGFRKGFVEQDLTRDNLTALALSNIGTAASTRAVTEQLQKNIDSLNSFFEASFTSAETKEKSTKILQLEYERDALKNSKGGSKEEIATRSKRLEVIEDELKQLSYESPALQLGISSDKDYRERVTALSHRLQEAADGTMQYSEIMLQALNIYKQELEVQRDVTNALGDFKSSIENINDSMKNYRKTALVNNDALLSNTALNNVAGYTEKALVVDKVSNIVFSENNQQLLDTLYNGLTKEDIIQDLMNRSATADGNYGLSDYYDYVKNNDELSIDTEKGREALANEVMRIIAEAMSLTDLKNSSEFTSARNKLMIEADTRVDRYSLLDGVSALRSGNSTSEQRAIRNLGLDEKTSFNEYTKSLYLKKDEDGNFATNDTEGFSQYVLDQERLNKLLEDRAALGLSNEGLEGLEFISDDELEKLKEAEKEFVNLTKLSINTNAKLVNLGKSMEDAFDDAIVEGISNSMVTLGEGMRDGVDATEDINKGLRDTFTGLLKSIGPQMTKTGLAIAAAGAEEGSAGWGKVMGGLGLAAAGGFLSWSGGLLSDSGNKDDKDAQKEARLKSLADILSDLIAQAKTDAEYYERNTLHQQALSADYGISSRKVNDMIITPQGNFSTHPDDTIMAMKHPEDLMKGGSPNINITIVNQSGDVVKVASTQKKEDENGNIDIQAVIVAVTSEAIATGEMDGAFAQMQARQKGVSRTF